MIKFDLVSKPAVKTMRDNATIRSLKEREAIGFYLSEHPIAQLRKDVDGKLQPLISLSAKRGYIQFLCYLERTREHRTKNGELMMFGVGADDSGKIDLVIFPKIYQQYRDILMKGNYLLIDATKKEEHSCIVNKIVQISMQEGSE